MAVGPRLNLFESGTVVSGGWQMLGGKNLYTDIFAFYGPLTYLQAGLTSLVGPGLTGIYLADLLSLVLPAVCGYLLAARISGQPRWSLLVPVLLALSPGSLSARSVLPTVAVLALAGRRLGSPKRRSIIAGAAAGLSLCYLQDAGLAITAALLVGWVATRWLTKAGEDGIRLRWCLAGGLIGASPVIVWMWLRGTLTQWLWMSFVFPLTAYTQKDATAYLRDMVAGWSGETRASVAYKSLFYLFPYVAIVALAVGCLWLCWRDLSQRPRGAMGQATFVWAAFSVLQLRTLAASLDEIKLAVAAGPVLTLAVALALRGLTLGRGSGQRSWLSPSLPVAAATIAWLVIWPLQKTYHTATHLTVETYSAASGRLAPGLTGGASPVTTPAELQRLLETVDRLAPPGSAILVLPTSPYVFYLTRHPNAARYDYLDPVYTTADVDAELASVVRSGDAGLVILSDAKYAGKIDARTMAPTTIAAVESGYQTAERFGPWTVWVRKP